MPHLERDCPGVLTDRGRPPRLGDGERKEGGDEGGGEGGDDEQAVHSERPGGVENVEPKRGRVCIPSIAYLASNSNGAGVDVPSCVLPTEPEINSASDVYALKTASEPTRVQSQLNVHDLLWASGEYLGRVANLCNLAATRALAVLFREGVRVLSVFEVLVFTYHWLRRAAKDGARTSVLRADGWTLQGDSPAEVPVQGGGEDGPGDVVSNEAAAEHLGVLLVVSVGARNGKRPTLPKLDGVDVLVDNETSKVFSTLLDGLRAYSQVSIFADATRAVGRETEKLTVAVVDHSVVVLCWPFRPRGGQIARRDWVISTMNAAVGTPKKKGWVVALLRVR